MSVREFPPDDGGASALEFALIAPVFMLLFVATIDFGMAMYNKFSLNGAVSAAANYTILNASEVNSTSGANLAHNLGLIIANQQSANWANATITVNNGPIATLTGGVLTTSGTAAPANDCYCATPLAGGGVAWGSAMTCGVTCSTGGIAGKFVSIVATTQYQSIFGSSGVIPSGLFTTTSVVETN